MPETIIFPDCVAVCRAYLTAALAEAGDTETHVGARVNRAARQATLRLVDAEVRNMVIQRSTIVIEIRTGDQPTAQEEAQDLGQLLHGLLFAMKGTTQAGARIYTVEDTSVQGLTDDPDPLTGRPRYTFAVVIAMRGGATLDTSTVITVPDWLRVGVESVVAGANVTVDDTDPQNPIVSSTVTEEGPGTFTYDQNVAASTWTIVHNLGFFPNVTTVDTLDREFLGDVAYVDLNTVTVTFASAVTGRAYLS